MTFMVQVIILGVDSDFFFIDFIQKRKQAVEDGKKDTDDILKDGQDLVAEANTHLEALTLGLDVS